MAIYAVDFDGTLCKNEFPIIGEPNKGVIAFVKKKKAEGNKIILWTCREENFLKQAVKWCEDKGIIFDAVNENVEELRDKDFAKRKIYADYYLDDRNLYLITPDLNTSYEDVI